MLAKNELRNTRSEAARLPPVSCHFWFGWFCGVTLRPMRLVSSLRWRASRFAGPRSGPPIWCFSCRGASSTRGVSTCRVTTPRDASGCANCCGTTRGTDITRGADIWGATRGAEICGATKMCGAGATDICGAGTAEMCGAGAVEICGAGATWGTGAAGGANPPLLGCAPAVVASAMERMTKVAVRMFDCNTKRDLIGAPINRPSGVLVAPVQVPARACLRRLALSLRHFEFS